MADRSRLIKPIYRLWIIGGAVLTAIGLLLLVLFVSDQFAVAIAGIAGVTFVGVGAIGLVLGLRGVRQPG